MGIKYYMEKIIQKGTSEDMDKLEEIFVEMYEHIEKCEPDKADEINLDIYEMACGKVITEDMAHDWVHSMRPYGEHWDKVTTTKVLKDKSVSDIRETDFYVVMNMLYNDNEEKRRKVIDDENIRTQLYINDSISWLKDVDAIEGSKKLYEYWKYIVK